MALLDSNGTPVLDLSEESAQIVKEHDGLLTGTVVYLDNPPGHTFVQIGGETLDEALKSVVGLFDIHHSGVPGDPQNFEPPRWIASTSEALGRLLAEHYGCEFEELGA